MDDERSENGQTPLIVAAQNGHIGVLELLLSRGIIGKFFMTLWDQWLFEQALMNWFFCVDANIHAVDDDGRNALCWACINNRVPCTSLLVERGSKLDLFDKNMRAPFHYAAQYGCKQLVIILDNDDSLAPSA